MGMKLWIYLIWFARYLVIGLLITLLEGHSGRILTQHPDYIP